MATVRTEAFLPDLWRPRHLRAPAEEDPGVFMQPSYLENFVPGSAQRRSAKTTPLPVCLPRRW